SLRWSWAKKSPRPAECAEPWLPKQNDLTATQTRIDCREVVMNRKARHGEKGAELIEMAFVLLIFLVLMIGVFQFGRGYNIYQNITNAAREGARFAVAPQRGGTTNFPNNTEVSNVINSFMQSSNLDPGAATINIQLNNQNV